MSTLTGAPAEPGQLTDPAYWVGTSAGRSASPTPSPPATAAGVTTFVELGPDGVLTGMAEQTLDGHRHARAPTAAEAPVVPALRKDRDEARALRRRRSAGLHARGRHRRLGPAFFAGPAARRVDLPTYAFQRERYWLRLRDRRR